MTDYPSTEPGNLLVLLGSNGTQQITISKNIPVQTLYLIGYAFYHLDDSAAKAAVTMSIDLGGMLSSDYNIDNRTSDVNITLPVSHTAATIQMACRIPYKMSKQLNQTFVATLTESDGLAPDKLLSGYLLFETTINSVS